MIVAYPVLVLSTALYCDRFFPTKHLRLVEIYPFLQLVKIMKCIVYGMLRIVIKIMKRVKTFLFNGQRIE